MNTEILSKRRETFVNELKEKAGAVIFSANSSFEYLPFLQDKNFFYFTNLEIPSSIIYIKEKKNKPFVKLFIEREIPERVVWEGNKMSKEKAKEISGIDNIGYLDEFERFISSELNTLEQLYVNYGNSRLNQKKNHPLRFVNQARQDYPHLRFNKLTDFVKPLRTKKDKWEIEQLQKAIDVTAQGIKKIMETAKSDMMEYELEAILFRNIRGNGYKHWGFKPIIAAGKNATTLHYLKNNCKIEPKQLVLMDVGAACNNYSADISRTFPIEEKFSKRQKQVYEAVLYIQKEIINMIKPKVTMKELNEKTIELMSEKLKELKLIDDKKDVKKYYMHSIGHHLGLDTHDIGDRNATLEAGNVITVEPGIYIPEEGIGVRIEDDILVTESGFKNLTAAVPKEINELEKIRKKALNRK